MMTEKVVVNITLLLFVEVNGHWPFTMCTIITLEGSWKCILYSEGWMQGKKAGISDFVRNLQDGEASSLILWVLFIFVNRRFNSDFFLNIDSSNKFSSFSTWSIHIDYILSKFQTQFKFHMLCEVFLILSSIIYYLLCIYIMHTFAPLPFFLAFFLFF